MATKKSPLDAFASVNAGSNDYRPDDFPKLSELVKEHGFTAGISKYDEMMMEWKRKHERDINQRIAGKEPASL